MHRVSLPNGREVRFRSASVKDIDSILDLYKKVYSGKYTLKEAIDASAMREKIENPNYFWFLASIKNELIGSVIFSIDPVNKIGKAYAAVVLSEYRGFDIMRTMVLHALERLTKKTRTCDVVYATTRTVSIAPAVVLEHCGFFPMGIFPNVRKVQSFETHGLEIYFREGCLKSRKKSPKLVPEVGDFYKIVREILNLEEHEECKLEPADPRKMGSPIKFHVEREARELLKKFDFYQDHDSLDYVFFPFFEPNLNFVTEDKTAEIFVNFNQTDGHAVIIGYRYGKHDLRRLLMWFCEEAAKEGIRYIELLVNSYSPQMQRIALDSRFLPCAYFPAMRLNHDNQREDYIVFSRSFENLDFMDLHLSETNQKFLDAFMKAWYEMLVRCQPEFDDAWRIG